MADLNELKENGGQLLTFSAGSEKYGFYILDTADIIEIPPITKIPTAPDHVLGVINHRGKAVPAMDLRLRLGMEKGNYDERSCMIVVEINTMLCGIVVDRVTDVENISPEDLVLSPVKGGMVYGFVMKEGSQRISILDPEKLARI
ncbi:MAG: purine-binding chemotaxis protein CheW [Ruminococcus sp.]|nr:purine-binding chemotaxis protein CheW [Ruminococcus sp.]